MFCEEGVFSVAQSRRVLEAGADAGLTPKVHAEELAHSAGHSWRRTWARPVPTTSCTRPAKTLTRLSTLPNAGVAPRDGVRSRRSVRGRDGVPRPGCARRGSDGFNPNCHATAWALRCRWPASRWD